MLARSHRISLPKVFLQDFFLPFLGEIKRPR